MNVFQLLMSGATLSVTEEFNLADIIADGLGDYYRYHGSLTTPPCYESVIWTVFENPIPISSRQVKHRFLCPDTNCCFLYNILHVLLHQLSVIQFVAQLPGNIGKFMIHDCSYVTANFSLVICNMST